MANVNRKEQGDGFFKGEAYRDLSYLSFLSADAAPVLVSWLAQWQDDPQGISGEIPYAEQAQVYQPIDAQIGDYDSGVDGNTPEYIRRMERQNEKYDGLRQFNVSRFMAGLQLERLEECSRE